MNRVLLEQTGSQGLLFDGELLIAHLKSSPWTQLESDLELAWEVFKTIDL